MDKCHFSPFYNKTLIDQQFKMDRMYKCISKNLLGCDSTRLLFALSDFNTILMLNRPCFIVTFVSFFVYFFRELLLNNNCLRVLPYELGRLFQLQTLGLKGFFL